MNPQYDYTASGFDGFLSRSIDDLSQVNLDSQGPRSMSQAYDRSQVTGIIGDKLRTTNMGQTGELTGDITLKGTFRVGNIVLDGEDEKISMEDNNQKEFISFQEFSDGTRGFIIVKEGFSISDVIE